ncbi:Topoisomerase 1-associated factor 1 [Actinomortierella ambigua]|uniref:Topoisomerase 1-associated factor 1 n=1 Tax=Actinomortierella ambigua TaxID=1343610 RepID=A0A9P6Q493_9FUNG|nr:Topoisomerase 1-associated factor 1 [Actinomortierella ambigua]
MDKDIEDLLLSTCMALGGFEDQSIDDNDTSQVYVMGDEVLYCLKDIRKFIKYFEGRGDNPVLSFLGKINVLEKDLIPIILLNTPADNPTKERLIAGCLELMVYMTEVIDVKQLRDLAMQEEDLSIVGDLLEKQAILRQYKKAFLMPGVLAAILQVMLRPLGTEYRQRTTNDMVIIRLGLFLFRNLVAIEDTEDSVKGTMDQFVDSILQEEVLQRMRAENILELLVTLASSPNDVQLREWNILAMETLYYIFHRVDPAELIPSTGASGSDAVVKNTALADLLRKEEQAKGIENTSGMRRHSRFGTTAEVKLADGTRRILHNKGAFFKPLDVQLDSVKKPRMGGSGIGRAKPTDVYRKRTTSSGRALLRDLATTFLESGFNPLMESVGRDIRGNSIKIRAIHRTQHLYLMAFMLQFQRLYQGHFVARLNALKTSSSSSTGSISASSSHHRQQQARSRELEMEKLEELVDQYDFDLVAMALEVQSLTQAITQIRAMYETKPKKPEHWEEIGQALHCLQEQIASIEAMSKSPHQDYRDAADIVQYNLYYEESSLDLLVSMARSYHNQSKRYLGTLIKTIHLLLRMLEAFSRSKGYVTIRRKRMQKKKKDDAKRREGQQGVEEAVRQMSIAGDEGEENDEENDDDNDGQPRVSFQEHHLVFREFERKFSRETVVKTYCAYLDNFQELDEKALHYVAAMFHRIAVNTQDLGVFYSLSTLHLFHRVLQSGVPACNQAIVPCLTYIVHEFFKKWQTYPLLLVETLFPKTTRVSEDINIGRQAREEQAKLQLAKQEKKMKQMELEPDTNVSWDEQIVRVVLFLADDGKEELLDWVIKLLKDAIAQRELMNFRSETELAENPDLMHSVSNIEDIPINTDSVDRRSAVHTNFKFRLLFKLLQFERCDEDEVIKFKIPTSLPTDTLAHFLDVIQEAMRDDLDANQAEQAKQYIQGLIKQAKPKRKKRNTEDEATVNAGTQRPAATPVAYHTSAFILDSDDDGDQGDDQAFFEAEKRMRQRFSVEAVAAGRAMYEGQQKERLDKEKKAREERRRANAEAVGGLDTDDDEDAQNNALDEEEDDEEKEESDDDEDDSDSDANEKATATQQARQPKARPRRLLKGGETQPKSYNFFSDGLSDDDGAAQTTTDARDEAKQGQQRSQRRLALLEEEEGDEGDDDDDENERREAPISVSTPKAASRKRRLLMDSDDEEDDVGSYDLDVDDEEAFAEAQASIGMPPFKKQAVLEVE